MHGSVPDRSVGFSVFRLASGALACALALSLSLSACSGGENEAAPAGGSRTASATPTPSPYGEPAYANADAAFAALTDYNRRNNAIIPIANKPPFAKEAFAPVDTGPTLAVDRWHAALAKADPGARHDVGWNFMTPVATYLPASKTWPKLVLVAAYNRFDGHKPPKPSKLIPLTVFVQRAEGAPLKMETSALVLRRKLPVPLAAGADPAPVDRGRAVSLARAVAEHWSKDTPSAAGFASTKALDRDLAEDRAQHLAYSARTWTARLLGKPGAAVRTVPVTGGTLVVADYRITKVVRAVGAGSYVFWTGDNAKVLGGDHRRMLTGTSYSSAAWFMPADGGPAQPLGETRQSAIF